MGLLQFVLGLPWTKGESPKDSYNTKPRENPENIFRTFLEQACHNQMDDGKNMAARIGGIMKAPQKALVWQSLDLW